VPLIFQMESSAKMMRPSDQNAHERSARRVLLVTPMEKRTRRRSRIKWR